MKGKEESLKKFGNHLRKLRESKGLSLRELELRGDLSRQYISDIETGKVNFTFYTLLKLCDLLEIDLAEATKEFKI